MSRWSETEVKCWIPKSSELEVGQITHFHNVDCHAYESRIAELTAELARVKAESLRVVAIGEQCEYRKSGERFFLQGGQIQAHDATIEAMFGDTIVQPVRLERWEEEG